MSFVIARWIVGVFTFISMVHLYWAADYSDTYAELVAIHYEHLIHQPPIK